MMRSTKTTHRLTATVAVVCPRVDGLRQIPAGFSAWNHTLGSGVV